MSEELDLYTKMMAAEDEPNFTALLSDNSPLGKRLMEHRQWLKSIRHERPSPSKQFRIGVYIRYFNQTKHDNYLNYHVKQYEDTIALCPNWSLVDFYIDEGASAPNMESAKEWTRLLNDCFSGKVNLIITQKVSNVSKKSHEITLLARTLAAMKPPIGIYFISEDIYTLASYYIHDLKDMGVFPSENWECLPNDPNEVLTFLPGGDES